MADPRMPSRDHCVIRDLVDRHARERPDRTFAVFDDASRWSFRELREQVRGCAAGLQALGVRQDDFVLCWLPNGRTCLTVMLALNYLGAVYVPINTGYRGGLLAHVIENSGASLMIADGALVQRLGDVPLAGLRDLLVLGPAGRPPAALRVIPAQALQGDAATLVAPARLPQPWDILSIIYTSGTTGPSKGVLITPLQMWSTFIPNNILGPDDRTLVNLPMFHVGGAGPIWSTLMRGGSFALLESFRTADFWQKVRQFDIGHTILLGAMTPFLLKEPPGPADRDHPLRRVSMNAIRRRGENISSFEVEKELAAHPDVRDAAVVAVPSEYGEDEVLAVLAPVPGRRIDLPALVEFARPRLAHFMVPRYYRIVDDLPRTPTEKVQKHLLRAAGLTPDTWDREAAGIVLKRERLSRDALPPS